jgi:hypothetical protein
MVENSINPEQVTFYAKTSSFAKTVDVYTTNPKDKSHLNVPLHYPTKIKRINASTLLAANTNNTLQLVEISS